MLSTISFLIAKDERREILTFVLLFLLFMCVLLFDVFNGCSLVQLKKKIDWNVKHLLKSSY